MLKLLFQQLDCIPFLFFFTESTESLSTGQCLDPERLREAPAPGPTEATADSLARRVGGSPKSPTPPSSPHLAVPPPALLHAPTPLPRYPGTLNDVILPLQGGSGRASRLSIRKPFLGGPGATTPFTEGGRQVPSMDLTQLFKITEGSTHVPVLPCQETKQKVNWGQSVRDPRTDAERAQRPRRRDAQARAARPSSPRPAFVLFTRFRLSYHTHCLPTAP